MHARDVQGQACVGLILYLPEQLFQSPVPSALSAPCPPPLILNGNHHTDGSCQQGSGWLSVPTPTQALTDTGQERVQIAGLLGRAPQTEQQLPGEACCGQLARGESALLVACGRAGRSAEVRPSRPSLVEPKLWAAGQLPGAVSMAQVCTWPHIQGYAWRGHCRTQAHRSDAGAGAGPGRSGWGVGTPQQGHRKAHRTMAYPARLKAAGEQELKICSLETGDYPAGAGEVEGQGSELTEAGGKGRGQLEGRPMQEETRHFRVPVRAREKGGQGRVERPVETQHRRRRQL